MGAVRKPPKLKLALGEITSQNLKQVEVLNAHTFPIVYGEKFYTNLLKDTTFTRLGFFADVLSSAICCRVDERKDAPPGDKRRKRICVLTLSVLPAYTRRGFATQLLEFLDKAISEQPNKDEFFDIYLHVHVDNEAAMKFYENNGFTRGERVEGYYSCLSPPDCFLFSKELNVKEE